MIGKDLVEQEEGNLWSFDTRLRQFDSRRAATGQSEYFKNRATVGVGNCAEGILMAARGGGGLVEALADALEIFAFFGMVDE